MSSLKSKIESLLFISAKPMSQKQLVTLLKNTPEEIKAAGEELVEFYKDKKSGIQIIKNGSKFQMVSSPENSKLVQEFISDETTGELSRPSLETLTIVAYRGPITKLEIEKIRGVNCSIILRNLLLRGLVETKPGETEEEIWYSVTFDFMRYLGINDISELPNYDKLNSEEAITNLLSDKKEDDSMNDEKVKMEEAEAEAEAEDNDIDYEKMGEKIEVEYRRVKDLIEDKGVCEEKSST